MVDSEDPHKYNGDGISVSICKAGSVGFDSAIQMIDAKQKEIDRIKYLADRRNQFTDELASVLARESSGG